MKNNLLFYRKISSGFYSVCLLLTLSAFVLMQNNGMCQDKKEDSTKVKANMNLSCKTSDGVMYLKVKITKKVNRKSMPVDDAKSPVSLYLKDVKAFDPSTKSGLIAKLFLDDEGKGVFDLPSNFNQLIAGTHQYKFVAQFNSDPLYEDAEQELTISDAKISIDYSGKDSTVTATLTEWKDSSYVPVAGVAMQLSIKRMFSLFPFGDEGLTTDKEGKVSAVLPSNIPGAADGKLTVVASVLDNDNYGTVECTKQVDWKLFTNQSLKLGRSLWSNANNAPVPLVIAVCSIIAGIWGTLIYLVFQLVKIKRLGKEESQ